MSDGLERLWAGWRSAYVEGVADRNDATAATPDRRGCLFCELRGISDEAGLVLTRAGLCFAVMNAFPYTSGHLMVAPVRHVATLADLTDAEATALMRMVQDATRALEAAYHPEGQNVGVNIGRSAGAGIPGHVHVHALPRWNGDTNFMTAVAEVRVLPEALPASYAKLRAAWPA